MTSYSGRIILASLYVTNIIFMIHYSNVLISVLTLAKGSLPFSTMDQMLKEPDYDFGIAKGYSVIDTLEVSDNFMRLIPEGGGN